MIMRGKKINSLDELKQNFSIDELIYYYYSGELEIWLTEIGETAKAEKLKLFQNNAYLLVQIYELFGLELEVTEDMIRTKSINL